MSSSIKYYSQLDSLRALAVLAVLAQHFFEHSPLIAAVPLGDLGVRLFFVLSGFLITSILLSAREGIQNHAFSRNHVFYHFYMRRFFRLFPIYYLYLLLVFMIIEAPYEVVLYFFSYLQNILFISQNGFGEYQLLKHFWTLAVEEQFYIVWPFIIIFTPWRLLLPLLISFVFLGVISRGLMIALGASHFQTSMTMFAHFDTLAIGSCLAYFSYINHPKVHIYSSVCAVLGFLLLVIVFVSKVLGMSSVWELLLGEIGAGLLFVGIINLGRVGIGGPFKAFLENPLLIYLGKISYGMYVYHILVFYLLDEYALKLPTVLILGLDLVNFIFYTFCAILVSAISWHIYELPINKFKHKFTMSPVQTGLVSFEKGV